MIIVIALSVIAGILSLYYLLFNNLNFFKKYDIPHVTPLPIVGNMGPIFCRQQSMDQLVKKIYNINREAKYVGMYDLHTPIIVLRDPELIKSVTLKHFEMFPDHRAFVNEHQDPLFGKNLFALRGERWKNVRAVLSPAFTSSKMKNMFKLISDYSAEFANFLAQLPPERKTMEMKDAFTKYTSDVIATCAFGVSVDSMRNPENDFYVYGKAATNLDTISFLKAYIIRTTPWVARIFNLKIINSNITNFFRNLIETTIKTRDEKNIVRPDMLQLMMENRGKEGKPELSCEDMVSQAFIFFFGGFDTTSTLMCFAAHVIAVNENVQEKLQNEIDQILEDTNGQVPYDVLNNMEYLDAMINETLRMYPIAAAMDRICVKDFELPPTLPANKPFIIKKGEIIWLPIYGLHHDPKYFKDPEKFDPKRFLGEQKKNYPGSGTYLPFGLGPRMCIGNRFALLETKLLLFHLLARCDLRPSEKTQIPLKIAKSGFNIKAEDGVWLKVVPRKNPHRTVAVNVANGASKL